MKKETKSKLTCIAVSTLCLFLAVSLEYGCKKYEEGPALSFRSKKARVDNVWKIEKYYENTVDMTAAVLAADDITIELTKDGKVTWTEIDLPSMNSSTDIGSWEFTDKKVSLLIKISGGVTFSGTGTDVWEILRLKNKEFWFTVMNGNDKLEIHLVSK